MISSGRPKVSRFGVTKIADPARLEHARRLGEHPLGVRHVLDRVHGEHRGEARRPANGSARMSATCVSRSWPASALGVDVHADGLARREQVVAVADAAAEVEHAARPAGTARRARRRRRGAARSG